MPGDHDAQSRLLLGSPSAAATSPRATTGVDATTSPVSVASRSSTSPPKHQRVRAGWLRPSLGPDGVRDMYIFIMCVPAHNARPLAVQQLAAEEEAELLLRAAELQRAESAAAVARRRREDAAATMLQALVRGRRTRSEVCRRRRLLPPRAAATPTPWHPPPRNALSRYPHIYINDACLWM